MENVYFKNTYEVNYNYTAPESGNASFFREFYFRWTQLRAAVRETQSANFERAIEILRDEWITGENTFPEDRYSLIPIPGDSTEEFRNILLAILYAKTGQMDLAKEHLKVLNGNATTGYDKHLCMLLLDSSKYLEACEEQADAIERAIKQLPTLQTPS